MGAESETDRSSSLLSCLSAHLGPVALVLRMCPAVTAGQERGSMFIARAGPPQARREEQAESFLLSESLYNSLDFACWPARPRIFALLPFAEEVH